MKSTLLTTYNWYLSSQPTTSIDLRTQEHLSESAITHINEMIDEGYTSGELNTHHGDEETQYQGTWSLVDVSRPKELYSHLVKSMKDDLINLIRERGQESKHVSNVNVLDIAEFELEIGGEHIETIGEMKLYSPSGLEFNLCLLEMELERVLDIIEDIKES